MTYQPPQLADEGVQQACLAISLKYADVISGLDAKTLRWFLYAIMHRESTFNKTLVNYNDGAANWNNPPSDPCFWPTADHVPHGCGLVQTTGWTHEGMPYPNRQHTPPTSLNKGVYGIIVPAVPVSAVATPFDPVQNLERFVTEHVLPDFVGIYQKYPTWTIPQILRAVAFHWNKGDWVAYDPGNTDYLALYDQYVSVYEPAVMSDVTWPAPDPYAEIAALRQRLAQIQAIVSQP